MNKLIAFIKLKLNVEMGISTEKKKRKNPIEIREAFTKSKYSLFPRFSSMPRTGCGIPAILKWLL